MANDPAKKVSIEISGIPDAQESDRVLERVDQAQKESKKWTDGSSNVLNWNGAGQKMTVEVTPVSDVDAFVKKIDFGDVTSVEGRTIKVAYRQSSAVAAIAATAGLNVATEPYRGPPLVVRP